MLEITLDGETLSPAAAWKFCSQAAQQNPPQFKIHLEPRAVEKVKKAEQFVEDIIRQGSPVYGINTGFGIFSEVSIPNQDLETLQRNIILSHACGVGPELTRTQTLGLWILRLNTLLRGNSGIRLSTLEFIIRTLEAGILSCIPSRGSVGASGDLAPSAHAVLPLLGEGEVSYPGASSFEKIPAKRALVLAKLSPIQLGPKEGLALINGTQLTTWLALEAWSKGCLLLQTANCAASMSIEGLRGTHLLAHEKIAELRRHPGASICAEEIRTWLSGKSEISNSHKDCGKVQDPYSLRCAPQVHGAIWDSLQNAEEVLKLELNSSTDNPLLIPEEKLSLSGGNFHAIYTARVSDQLASALTTLGNISERRISLLMKTETSRLPTFLTKKGGLESGLMMAQVTAAALVSECKTLCFPASVDSIPTNCEKEDHVSMGPSAGFKVLQICERLEDILAIELLAASQALYLLEPLGTSPRLQKIYFEIRRDIPPLEEDRILAEDFKKMASLIQKEIFCL